MDDSHHHDSNTLDLLRSWEHTNQYEKSYFLFLHIVLFFAGLYFIRNASRKWKQVTRPCAKKHEWADTFVHWLSQNGSSMQQALDNWRVKLNGRLLHKSKINFHVEKVNSNNIEYEIKSIQSEDVENILNITVRIFMKRFALTATLNNEKNHPSKMQIMLHNLHPEINVQLSYVNGKFKTCYKLSGLEIRDTQIDLDLGKVNDIDGLIGIKNSLIEAFKDGMVLDAARGILKKEVKPQRISEDQDQDTSLRDSPKHILVTDIDAMLANIHNPGMSYSTELSPAIKTRKNQPSKNKASLFDSPEIKILPATPQTDFNVASNPEQDPFACLLAKAQAKREKKHKENQDECNVENVAVKSDGRYITGSEGDVGSPLLCSLLDEETSVERHVLLAEGDTRKTEASVLDEVEEDAIASSGNDDVRVITDHASYAKNENLDAKGNDLDAKDNDLDAKGNGLDAKGNDLDAKDNDLDAKGNGLDAKGNDLDAKGKDLGAKGNDLDTNGNDLDAKGNDLDAKGNDLDAKGKDLGAKGNDLDTNGNDLDAKGNDLDAKGHDLNANGSDLDTKGSDPDAKGNDLDAKGSDLDTDKSLDTDKLIDTKCLLEEDEDASFEAALRPKSICNADLQQFNAGDTFEETKIKRKRNDVVRVNTFHFGSKSLASIIDDPSPIRPSLRSTSQLSLSSPVGYSSAKASALIIETDEKKYYHIPPAMARRGNYDKNGTKLHVYNGHIFVAQHFSKSPPSCLVCSLPLTRRIGKQGYQCRDCKIITHKRCHNYVKSHCQGSSFGSLEIEYLGSTEV